MLSIRNNIWLAGSEILKFSNFVADAWLNTLDCIFITFNHNRSCTCHSLFRLIIFSVAVHFGKSILAREHFNSNVTKMPHTFIIFLSCYIRTLISDAHWFAWFHPGILYSTNFDLPRINLLRLAITSIHSSTMIAVLKVTRALYILGSFFRSRQKLTRL